MNKYLGNGYSLPYLRWMLGVVENSIKSCSPNDMPWLLDKRDRIRAAIAVKQTKERKS